MKLSSKRRLLMACMAAAMLLSATLETNAQVPSIPRKTTTNKAKKTTNVVWGTQYDYLSTRYLTEDDISGYDRGQIRVLKNSIYARHGRIFKDKALREYFNEQSWYRGTRNEVPAGEFNKYENANIMFLKKYE